MKKKVFRERYYGEKQEEKSTKKPTKRGSKNVKSSK